MTLDGIHAEIRLPTRRTGEALVRFLHERGLDIELRVKHVDERGSLYRNDLQYGGTHVHVRLGELHASRFIDDAYLRDRSGVIDWTIDKCVQMLMFDQPEHAGLGCDCF